MQTPAAEGKGENESCAGQEGEMEIGERRVEWNFKIVRGFNEGESFFFLSCMGLHD